MGKISLNGVLETAVRSEDIGVRVYSELAKKFSKNSELKSAFELLAKDEVEHKKQFSDLLADADTINYEVTELDQAFLNGVDLARNFSQFEQSVDKNVTDALRIAYDFEKESVLFYLGISDMIGGHPVLNEIIKIEKMHMTKLMSYIVSEAEFRGISDKF